MRRRRFEVCVSMHGGFHQRIQELNFTRLPVYTSHWSDWEEEIFGGWKEVSLDSIEVEASTHLVFSSIWTRAQQRLSFYLICASAQHWLLLLLLPRIPVSSCLPCLALLPCLLARESRQALITQASQQFISTGEPTANWKTCTLATIYNESYPVLLSPRLGSINAT